MEHRHLDSPRGLLSGPAAKQDQDRQISACRL